MATPTIDGGHGLGHAAHIIEPGQPCGEPSAAFGGLPALWRFRNGLAPRGLALGRGGELVAQIGER
jgi:hypothetical protein